MSITRIITRLRKTFSSHFRYYLGKFLSHVFSYYDILIVGVTQTLTFLIFSAFLEKFSHIISLRQAKINFFNEEKISFLYRIMLDFC